MNKSTSKTCPYCEGVWWPDIKKVIIKESENGT
jgi:hypothetical protein